jgi:predicted PurR-regulated permease PerM
MTDRAMPDPEVEIVPDWLGNLAALGWRMLAIAALVVAGWYLCTVLWVVAASIAVAIVIAAAFAPLVVRLRSRGRSRTAAAAIVWLAALLILGGTAVLLAVAVFPYVAAVVTALADGLSALKTDLAAYNLPPEFSNLVGNAVSALRGLSADLVGQVAGSVADVVTVIVLATFLVFFFLQDGDKAWVWIFQAASAPKRERIFEAGDDALWRVGGYLRGTTILAAIVAVTDYVFMFVVGTPLAVPLAVFAFFGGYIPYFGGIVATLVILFVTYAAQGTGATVAMILLLAVRNAILGYGVRPIVYGRTVSIHPALVLVVLPAGFELAGVIGLFAAVPVTAIVFAVATAAVAILDPGPNPDLPALVPGWLDRLAQFSWRALVAVGLGALLVGIFVAMPLVLIPVLLATILAATLDPFVRSRIRKGSSRARAAAIGVGGGFLAIVAVVGITFVTLFNNMTAMNSGAAAGASTADTATGGYLGVVVSAVRQGGGELTQTILAASSAIAQVGVIIIFSILLTFYFLRDGGKLWDRVLRRARPDVAPEIDDAGNRAFNVLGGYMIGTGAISFVGAASQAVIMLVLGLPYVLPVFVLSFILCFIPYIGGFISTGLAFLITIAYGSPTDIVVMLVWTLVFNIVTGNIVAPLVYGKTVHLHPAIVLVAIPAGAAVAGMLGMFIVVPILGVVAVSWRTVLRVIGLRRRELDEAMAASVKAADTPPDALPAPASATPAPAPEAS